jgi:steroid delta-isomerase-like uncharacterized protein
MATQSTKLTKQQLIAAAKAPLMAFNDKNWDTIRSSITPDFVYDEVGTHRIAEGADEVLSLWRGWAAAIPDSKATIDDTHVSGSTVIFEVTWRGTHQGAIELSSGSIAGTGNRVELRSCIVMEMMGDKAKSQRQYFDMTTLLQQIGVWG